MYEIEPHNMGIVGTATFLNVYAAGFSASDTACGLSYQLFNAAGHAIYSNGLTLSGADYENWGADNYYLVEYVATTLGLTLIEA
jgi:hypothetical protein